MKKLFLTASIALFTTLSAQKANFGVNAGLLSAFAKVKTPVASDANSETGFYVGFFAEINAGSKVKVQPAVNYANIQNGSALQIPIMVKYYVDPKFNLQVGPQFTFDFEENPLPDYYNPTNIGMALGAAYDFSSKFFVEGRYAFQLNNHLKNMPSGYSAKINFLNVGLGYKF
ncbi:PorT family protein [Chryseobacterium sp. SNU WT5]|uniref:porin family protein n=1 Tax=Chryseobacterium sp. SNU WT5 TaxID=2594269 RepID=UPI00117EB3C3|nr:porin family protein [Chryseobacterium sp. SNU WT5]QDP86375.1 PorT family protein [Chryseobacterium sp. SNU WT5]